MKRWVWLVVASLALLGSVLLRPALQARQQDEGLVLSTADTEGLSADVAVPTLALGAFRGLVTDYLWLRSISLREQGKNYEARQLAEQICRLQPRLGAVWSYLAHDLSYNLAATEARPEGRWRWIQAGISLLRDHGLRLNPDDPELYFQLSRIFQDKIGATFDEFHREYKRDHALGMEFVLGGLTVEELNATPPVETLLAQDPDVRALQAQVRAAGGGLVDVPTGHWILGLPVGHRVRQGFTADRPQLVAVLREARGTPAYERALRSLRRDLLVNNYKLEPLRMLEIDRAWGPLDWRGSDASAIYWALEGMRVAGEKGDIRQHLRLRRVAVQALKLGVRRGRMTRLADGRVFFAPMAELVERTDQQYLESIRIGRAYLEDLSGPVEDDGHGHGGGGHDRGALLRSVEGFLTNQDSAREDFLGEGIVMLSEYGAEKQARALHARAQADYKRNYSFRKPYDEFMIAALSIRYADPEMYDTPVGVSQAVEGAWTSAFRYLALGQDERYRGLNNLARNVQLRWQRYVLTLPAEDQRRMQVPYEAIRKRAAYRIAEQLKPQLRERLSQRLGIPVEELLKKPPPVSIKPPRFR